MEMRKEGWTYIHGSVDESPSGDLVRSLERPGAKIPRPYPRAETTHGSFTVNLDPHTRRLHPQLEEEERHSPILDAVSERFEADAGKTNKVLGHFVLVQPTAIAVVEALREIPVVQRLGHSVC